MAHGRQSPLPTPPTWSRHDTVPECSELWWPCCSGLDLTPLTAGAAPRVANKVTTASEQCDICRTRQAELVSLRIQGVIHFVPTATTTLESSM
mmetsp:Transcript_27901/g.76146  ORF Transcript_27901/g.76146 Transcript_27901/m.76146 type:complete len:93 (+) Transcript_27901:398-676(+)